MGLRITVLIILITSTVWGELDPCFEGRCFNFKIFMNEKPSQKNISLPTYPKFKGPGVEEIEKMNKFRANISLPTYPKFRGPDAEEVEQMNKLVENVIAESPMPPTEDRPEEQVYVQRPDNSRLKENLWPRHRPVPDDDTLTVGISPAANLSSSDQNGITIHGFEAGSTSPITVTRPLDSGALDLSNIDLSGDKLRSILLSIEPKRRYLLRRLNLTRSNLSSLKPLSIPQDVAYHLMELRLDYNQIGYRSLSPDTIKELLRLGSLQVLGLSHAGIRTMDSPLLIYSLEQLDLSYNHLTVLPAWLEKLTWLKRLELSGNNIHEFYFPPNKFNELQVLSLVDNNIKYLPKDSFKNLRLEKLNLGNNTFRSLEPLTLHSYTMLFLGNNSLLCDCSLFMALTPLWGQVVDKDKTYCEDFISVKSRWAKLSRQCEGVVYGEERYNSSSADGNKTSLSSYKGLTENKQEVISNSFQRNTIHLLYGDTLDLSGLDLSDGRLKNIIRSIDPEQRTKIKRLILRYIDIFELEHLTFPEELQNSLKELRLDHNLIATFFETSIAEISRLRNLKVLGLSHTGLHTLDFLSLPSVEELYVSGNRLTTVPRSLVKLPKLRHLDISGNNIRYPYFHSHTFNQLQVLSLANNRITLLPPNTFNFMKLKQLNLTNNSLSTWKLLNLHPGTSVFLAGNPLRCDCSLHQGLTPLWHQVADRDQLRCDDGRPVASRLVEMVTECRDTGRVPDQKISPSTDYSHHIWSYRLNDFLRIIDRWLNWILISIILVVIVLVYRKKRKQTLREKIVYNIMDDKMLS